MRVLSVLALALVAAAEIPREEGVLVLTEENFQVGEEVMVVVVDHWWTTGEPLVVEEVVVVVEKVVVVVDQCWWWLTSGGGGGGGSCSGGGGWRAGAHRGDSQEAVDGTQLVLKWAPGAPIS